MQKRNEMNKETTASRTRESVDSFRHDDRLTRSAQRDCALAKPIFVKQQIEVPQTVLSVLHRVEGLGRIFN